MLAYIIYFFFSIIMGIVLLFLSLFNYKIRQNYFISHLQFFKLLHLKSLSGNKKILLFHAASAGEYEQIQPILRGLNRQDFFIIQTFTSPSIYNNVLSSSLYDIKLYHPFDICWLSYLFFKIIDPDKYIITRHDLWPGHILMANWLNIPIYYINANIHKNSLWYKKYFRFISRLIFKKINKIIVPSQEILNNILEFSPFSKLSIVSDTRFNQVIYLKNKKQNKDLTINTSITNTDIVVFGSIDQSDEKIIFNLLSLIKKTKKIILVPHEVDQKNITRIEHQLNDLSLDYSLFSDSGFDLSKNILLIDCLGLLASLYALGSHAYVGGGFKRGVHSVLEPAAYGCLIACGPNIEMLDEAKLLYSKGYLVIIKHMDDLLKFINTDYIPREYLDYVTSEPTEMINLLTSY